MEKELTAVTGAELKKPGCRASPPTLVQKPWIEAFRPTPWVSHSRPLRLLASRVRKVRGILSAIRAGKKSGSALSDFLDDFTEELNDVKRQCHLLAEAPKA
eukprot:11061382-Heterocapsa_arctica.AAC.1